MAASKTRRFDITTSTLGIGRVRTSQVCFRLSVTGAKLFGSKNPDTPSHWQKMDFLAWAPRADLRWRHLSLDDTHALPRPMSRRWEAGSSGSGANEDDEDRPMGILSELVAILRDHIKSYGTASDGRRSTADGYLRVWREARQLAFIPEQVESPAAGCPYDLRHAAASLWLRAGVHAPRSSSALGRSVQTLLKTYAKCIDGRHERADRRTHQAVEAL
ncbi:hypothetical protein [Nonomuraea sp. NPDC049607]|uniref:hypothetical protein n=1 Tax=unclassified Nonomuraea TaxID=2593643 RepID=UPI00344732B6